MKFEMKIRETMKYARLYDGNRGKRNSRLGANAGIGFERDNSYYISLQILRHHWPPFDSRARNVNT